MAAKQLQEIACQQILMEDSSVFSIQWSTFPLSLADRLNPQFLLERYLSYIRSLTLSVIRPASTPEGLQFRLLGTRLSLISFLPPIVQQGQLLLHICGGFLVQPQQCERGELVFSVDKRPNGIRVSLQLSEFCPLILGQQPSFLRRVLYRFTQAAIHRLVTVRFLARLYRELTGGKVCIRVVEANIRTGRRT